jgi:hypothetical protein
MCTQVYTQLIKAGDRLNVATRMYTRIKMAKKKKKIKNACAVPSLDELCVLLRLRQELGLSDKGAIVDALRQGLKKKKGVGKKKIGQKTGKTRLIQQ